MLLRLLALPADDQSVADFLALTGAFSVPSWVLGSVTRRQLLPGLPLSALMTVCPLAAATILTFRRSRWVGVSALLHRAVDVHRINKPL